MFSENILNQLRCDFRAHATRINTIDRSDKDCTTRILTPAVLFGNKWENYFVGRLPRVVLAHGDQRAQPWANFRCTFSAIQFPPASGFGARSFESMFIVPPATHCPRTRKNPDAFVMGRFVLLKLVVTMSPQVGGRASVRCTT